MDIVGSIPAGTAVSGDHLVDMAATVAITVDVDSMGLLVVFHRVQDHFRLLRHLRVPFIHDSEAGKD